jgi:aspartate/methionine/tyrosine aminotransferase
MTIRPFQLERYFARHEFSAPHLLACSDCESMSIGELLTLAGQAPNTLLDLRLGYTESQGDPALRATIAGFYEAIPPDHIVVTNAPEEAIFLAIWSLVGPGDRVVVQTPCYQSLFELARSRGARVQPWSMVETSARWRIDLDRLGDLVTPDTRLIVVNFPHNPTGYVPTAQQFEDLIAIAARYDAWLLCDEMYRGLEYDPSQRLPAAADRYSRAVSLWGMSKTFGLAGLRIGWLATRDAELVQTLLTHKDYTTICCSAPSEFLAQVALQNATAIIDRNVGIIRANLTLVRAFMDRHAERFAWRAPLAGPIAFPRLREGSAAAFCRAAVEGAGVLLAPSTLFDFGDAHCRWGLGRRSFAAGLAALEAHLATRT